ncbi:dynamin family protein [Streptomyces sp. NPDC046909]|uniref:dynamin family protein n=1 Tax=Streptomyces sp. NPDC046909 TaxID=3155617 RepID=UPI0033E3D94C
MGDTRVEGRAEGAEDEIAAAAGTLLTCADTADGGGAETEPLARALRDAAGGLEDALRLAVAGQIKRGKSTLVNALLGERVALTGQLELTYTVSELYYAEDRIVTVRHRDGSARTLPAEEFRRMTGRDETGTGVLDDVARVEYGIPNRLLRSFRLADTPGLGSVHGVDSQNTLDFLGISAFAGDADREALEAALAASGRTPQDVHSDSAREIREAEAVLYLFDRGLHERDRVGVREFLGGADHGHTPFSAFGVLSRVDQLWPPGPDLPGDPDPLTWDPMAESEKIIERYLERPEVRSLFFTIVPVSGLLGEGARLLEAEEIDHLDDLRKTEPPILVRRLRDAGRFARAEALPGVALPAARRRALVDRLGIWGIHLACGLLRDGADEERLRQGLVEASGVSRLRDMIGRHFGNRYTLIKLDHGLRRAEGALARLRLDSANAGHAVPALAATVAAELERLRARVSGFAELDVLAAHYRGELRLSQDETAQLRRITGEDGTSLPSRLGLPAGATPQELRTAALAAVHAWSFREQDPTLDRASVQAVRAVRRSCERLLHRVQDPTDRPGPPGSTEPATAAAAGEVRAP